MVSTYFDKAKIEGVKKCMDYEVQGARPKGRPKKTWRKIVKKTVGLDN